MSALATSIQHCNGDCKQWNKIKIKADILERSQSSLFTDAMILHVENPTESTKTRSMNLVRLQYKVNI